MKVFIRDIITNIGSYNKTLDTETDIPMKSYSQKMLDCDNHPEKQCQDHDANDVQVYHSDHRRGLSLLRKQLSSGYYQMLVYPQSHIFDGA